MENVILEEIGKKIYLGVELPLFGLNYWDGKETKGKEKKVMRKRKTFSNQ